MTSGGSLGLRSSSYGSLQQQQFQNNGGQQQKANNNIQSTPPMGPASSRKPSKMFVKENNLFLWMFKFVHRKKVGMMFLCLVSIAAMLWVLYVGKGVFFMLYFSSIWYRLSSKNEPRLILCLI